VSELVSRIERFIHFYLLNYILYMTIGRLL